ncbi:MAG: glycosyltransferase family 2 protein [Bacteroidetes bacterium]|nr:glycosyltransferase family 2 protein [Bacteroidota bacterium]
MKLSIIIVNYNVRYFLEQCLTSVLRATTTIDAQIFVVDNESKDGSVEMVNTLFPEVLVIANKKNVGFSKANNQAISIAKGEYILLLNPDTVVEEDTFEKCIDFMDKHPDAGGLGVKMIDGNGVFLPESKRGLPTPSVSFYKIFGLSGLFPKSKVFSKYHLGYLDTNQTNEIEILSGAFMWMRKSVLDKIGYLDESFFMYGEDIDLSYRILKAGYKNYYFPESKIIHYKGESTKKGSLNYVFVFYNAMIIFSKKHFAQKAKAFSFFINIAIYLRAFMAIIVRFLTVIRLPILDTFIILIILSLLTLFKPFIGFPNQIAITDEYGLLNVLTALFSIIVGLTLTKSYTKTVNISRTFLGLIIGSIILLLLNSSFPTNSSFSNKFITSILVGVFIFIPLSRIVLFYFDKLKIKRSSKKVILVAGKKNFITSISSIIKLKNPEIDILHAKHDNIYVENDEEYFISKQNQVADIAEIYNANEVIFSSTDITYKDIIQSMNIANSKYIDFKISVNNHFIIGSHHVEKII